MSVHQTVCFRAIDKPVSKENLAFMRAQSTRATVTAWKFDNEYNYSHFRGDVAEMMRRGYDFYFYYASYGLREIHLRFPDGLPDLAAVRPYLLRHAFEYVADADGPGCVLRLQPSYETESIPEIWELDETEDFAGVDALVALRNEILSGDLRPLYLAHLAGAMDMNHDPDEMPEPPTPAGLDRLTPAQTTLARIFDMDREFVALAASAGPTPTGPDSPTAATQAEWIGGLPGARRDRWFAELLGEDNERVRREILAEYRRTTAAPTWPTVRSGRTVGAILDTLRGREVVVQREADRRNEIEKAERKEAVVSGRAAIVRATDELAAKKGIANYREVAKMLAELHEAVAGTALAGVAIEQANKLKEEYPKQASLIAELRGKGLLVRKTAVRRK